MILNTTAPRWAFRWTLAGLLAAAAAARASDSTYQMYAVGDRAAGMGGAAVALANSVDACYYNPAGLVGAMANSLSLSANLYGFQTYTVESGLFPGDDVRSGSFVTIPSSMGGIYKVSPRWSLAVAALVPDRSVYSEIVGYDHNRRLYQYSIDDQTFWIGPSAGYALTPTLSLGASCFAVYRSFTDFTSVFYDSFNESYARARKFNDVSLAALLGLQWQPGGAWRCGLALQAPTVHVYDDGKITEHVVAPGVEGPNYYYTDDVKTDNFQPMKIALGLGRERPGIYAYGLDLTYHLPTSFHAQEWAFDGRPLIARVVRQPVLDINLGGEYVVRKIYPVRAGVYTGFSSVPNLRDAEEDLVATDNVDLYGLTASVGRETASTAFNIGLNYVFGRGTDSGWEIQDERLVRRAADAWEQQIYVSVNTAYYF